MSQPTNYSGTNRGVRVVAALAAASVTLALLMALRPGGLPERTWRWAGLQPPAAPSRMVLAPPRLRIVANASPGAAPQ